MPDNPNTNLPSPTANTGTTTAEPEHHQTQAAAGSPQSGVSTPSTSGSSISSGTTTANATSGGGVSGAGSPASRGSLSESAAREYGSQGASGSSGLSRGRSSSVPAFPMLGALGNPFGAMRTFADQMDRFFDDFFGMSPMGGRLRQPGQAPGLQGSSGQGMGQALSQGIGQGLWYPQVEVREREGKLVICADLPGMRKEDVHVEIRENALILQGERRQESEQGGESFYRSERSYGQFQRVLPLPEGVDATQAQASFKDGVLEITVPLPQRQAPEGRRIEIR